MAAPVRDQVFISYSHKDRAWLDDLHVMLKPLTRSRTITVWDDTQIRAGARWADEIVSALTRARVAVLLVSPHFLASDFIHEHELPSLFRAAEEEGLTILWVPVSACLYEETALAARQAVLNPTQPLDGLTQSEKNQALVKVCARIKAACENP